MSTEVGKQVLLRLAKFHAACLARTLACKYCFETC